jgi:transposase
VLDEASGEWWLAVETTEDRIWCESCGVRAIGHGRRQVVVGDLPLADRPLGAGVGQALVALRRAGVCDPDLVGGVRGDRATGRADRAGSGGDRSSCRSAEHSVAQAARDFGVLWHAAMAAVRDHGRPPRRSPRPPRRPSAVGLDETSFLAGTAQHPTMLVTGIVDLDEGRLVDVLPARRAIAVTD